MSDGSKGQPKMTAGLDLGDKYSYLCLIDTESGEVMEEGRLRTTPKPSDDASLPSSLLAHSHRGRNPLAMGEQSARRVRPRGAWWPMPAN